MDHLKIDDIAPEFILPALTKEGETNISLSEYRHKTNVVLYFYPKDDTPGCTAEACAFRDMSNQFHDAGATILGISPDSIPSHQKFAQKYGLQFPLLADHDHAVSELYGVWKEKTNYGKVYWGIERTTFVISKNGQILKIYPRVKVEAHAENVLEFIRKL